jgi:hypothetical protein
MRDMIGVTKNASTRRRVLTAVAAAVTVVAMAAPATASPHGAASHPSVSSLHLSPSTVAHGGGSVHLTATVHHAVHCKVTSSHSVSGLPVTHSCSSGHLSLTFHVGADPTAALRHLTITLKATSGSHHTTKTVSLTQAAAPAPSVSGFAASPAHLSSSGGTVHLTATVKHATTCKLSATPAVAGLPANVACTSTAFSRAVALPADTGTTARSYLFTLVAHGAGGSKTASTHPMATVAGNTSSQPISTLAASGAPLPGDATTGANEDAVLNAVSCGSAGHCVAVGDYYAPPGGTIIVDQPGLIETLDGTTWTASAAPVPSDVSATEPSVQLSSVSCSSATSCVAVGEYLDSDSGFEPYVATLSGTTWTWNPASVPTDPLLPDDRIGGNLVSVSCVSDGCVAVGYSQPPDEKDALIEEPVAGAWTGIQAALPDNADPEEDNETEIVDELYQVSCTTGPSCTAVGEYTTGSGPGLMTVGVGETLCSGSWTPTQLPPTADEGYDKVVSCASGDCAAAGEYDTSAAYIQTEVGVDWSSSDDITAPQPTTFTGAGLDAASCATSASCVLVGEAYNPAATATYGLIDSGSGTSYIGSAAPVPTNTTGGSAMLTAVSCPAAGSCGAVGYYRGTDDSGSYGDDLMEIETTASGVSTWTPSEVPLPSVGAGAVSLSAVSCVASWGCVAVGNYTPSGTGTNVDGELVLSPL